MPNVKILTLGFMDSGIIEKSFSQLYATKNPVLKTEHHVLWQHYPINKDRNFDELKSICKKYGAILHDAGKNLGLHDGFNYLVRAARCGPGDIVIGYDPDSYPTESGWDMALVRAIWGSTDTVWASLMNPRSREELTARGYDRAKVDGHIEVWKAKTAVVNSVCAWSVDWLKSVGMLTENRPFYGHLESAMWGKLGKKRWAFLPGWGESDHLRWAHDQKYIEYKWVHAHLKTWDGDFESWLNAGAPIKETAPPKLP
jgi:hypothetical protein